MRVLLFGAAWMLLLGALAFSLATSGRRPVPRVSATVRQSPPEPPPPPPRAGTRFPGWTVTRAYSAHHMMVVEVETDRSASSTAIAAQIVEPLKGKYDEVLIYIREPGQSADDLPARRIQWTPRGGYVEAMYSR